MDLKRRSDTARGLAVRLALWLLLSGISASDAISQETSASLRLEAGDRIRLVAPPRFPEPSTGRLVAFDSEQLYVDSLAVGADTVSIPRAAISRLDVSAGREHKTWTGIGIGAAAGAVAGLALAAGFCSDPDSGNCESAAYLTGFIVGALPGALLGGVVGSNFKGERWEEVPLQ